MPNPPKPVEVKRRNGNPGKRALPKVAGQSVVYALPMAVGVPALPNGVVLGLAGSVMWANVWSAGAVWISPSTDAFAVVEACQVVDDLAIARERYHATHEPADARVIGVLSKALTSSLSALGFDPTSRSRLGVAEVRALSTLEGLRGKRSKREASAG